jgi:phytoene synthase
MQDAFDHCAALVRSADRDRFLASLFAPAERRGALHALYAFNVEIARVREVAREPLPGEIRLQWWREVIGGERRDEAGANPAAAALLAVIDRYQLAAATLGDLIDAHGFDLYDEPMARLADLEDYGRNTFAAVIALAAQILGSDARQEIQTAAEAAGIAQAIAGALQALPVHAARHQLYVPLEILSRHGAGADDVFTRKSSTGVNAALAEFRDVARAHLRVAHQLVAALPEAVMPAFLPVALTRPLLDRLEHADPFTPWELPPWRRQWLIWRAARNPTRIAG